MQFVHEPLDTAEDMIYEMRQALSEKAVEGADSERENAKPPRRVECRRRENLGHPRPGGAARRGPRYSGLALRHSECKYPDGPAREEDVGEEASATIT